MKQQLYKIMSLLKSTDVELELSLALDVFHVAKDKLQTVVDRCAVQVQTSFDNIDKAESEFKEIKKNNDDVISKTLNVANSADKSLKKIKDILDV